MDDAEQKYREELTKAGVDLPELQEDETEPETEPEPQPEKEEDAPKPEEKTEEKPEPSKPRSIYDEYKDKKVELKSEKQARETAEAKVSELQGLLDARADAGTPEEKQDAQDEIDAFLGSHKEWNKDAIQDLIALARKGVKPEVDPELAKRLDRFEAWEKSTADVREKQLFNDEFEKSAPKLKEFFPTASQEEMASIKSELDRLSHTKEWHDKSLAYVAFEHRDTLSALISPKKRGMEGKGRLDTDTVDTDFDPNADYASMTPAQRKQWEATYQAAAKSTGLLEDAQGRKIII